MPITAAIVFQQGINVGAAGHALLGDLSGSVVVGNGSNTGVANWKFTLIDVPEGSAFTPGVVQNGATPTYTFTPDVVGTYRFELEVKDSPVTQTVTDFRDFIAVARRGWILSGFESTDSTMNYGSNTLGWKKSEDHMFIDILAHALFLDEANGASSGQGLKWNGSVWGPGNFAPSPTGTGIPHVIGGVTQAAATLIVDADVSGTAAISGSKVVPNFGSAALTAGASTLASLILAGVTFSAVAPAIGDVLTATSTSAVHWAAPAPGFTAGGDLTGTSSSQTVSKIQGVAISGTAGSGKVIVGTDSTHAVWGTVPTSGISGGSDGEIFITSGSLAVWTSLISLETTHGRFTSGGSGSDFKAVMGPYPTAETTFATLHFLATATAPNATNWNVAGNGTDTYLGIASGGTLRVSVPGVGDYWLFSPLTSLPSTYAAIYPGGVTPSSSNYAAFLALDGSQFGFNAGTQFNFNIANSNQLTLVAGTLFWSNSTATPTYGQGAPSSDVATNNLIIRAQAPFASAATNLLPGLTIIDIPSVVGAGNLLGGMKITYGGNNAVTFGTYGGTSGGSYSYAAIWFGTATAGAGNYAFLADSAGNNTYLNAASTIYFAFGGGVDFVTRSTDMTMGAAAAGAGSFNFGFNSISAPTLIIGTGSGVGYAITPTISIAGLNADVAAGNLIIHAQAPFASATVHKDPGSNQLDTPVPVSGSSFAGGTIVTSGGFELARIGMYNGDPTSGFGGMWFAGNHSLTDFAFLGNPGITYLNASTDLYLIIGGTTGQGMHISGTSALVLSTGSLVTSFEFLVSNTATTVTWDQVVAASDVAPANWIFSAQAPFASAVTHIDAGDIIVNTKSSISGTTKYGGFQVQYNGASQIRMGTWGSGNTYGAIWFRDGGSPTNANFSFLGSQTETYFNVPTGGNMYFSQNNSVFMNMTTSKLSIGASLASNNGLIIDFTSATAPLVQGSTNATAVTVGTNKSGASLILRGGAATTILTLTTSAEFSTQVKYDDVATPSTPTGGGILFSSSGAGKWIGTSGTITTFGPADPHCERCGADFAVEWESPKGFGRHTHRKEKLSICFVCLSDSLHKHGIDLESFAIHHELEAA